MKYAIAQNAIKSIKTNLQKTYYPININSMKKYTKVISKYISKAAPFIGIFFYPITILIYTGMRAENGFVNLISFCVLISFSFIFGRMGARALLYDKQSELLDLSNKLIEAFDGIFKDIIKHIKTNDETN